MEFQQYSDGMHLAAAYVKNALGDVVGTYDVMSGVTLYREYCYDAYGNPVEEYDFTDTTPPSENPFRYRGEYYDAETGLYYLRNRYYDPKAGRFITEDPIRDGTNWYTYCNGNPVMFVDPMGFEVTKEDQEAYENGSLNFANYERIQKATEAYNEAAKVYDYTGMALAHREAVMARRTYDPDYQDDYNYYVNGRKVIDDGEAGAFRITMSSGTSSYGAVVSIFYTRSIRDDKMYVQLERVTGDVIYMYDHYACYDISYQYRKVDPTSNQRINVDEGATLSFSRNTWDLEEYVAPTWENSGLFHFGVVVDFEFRRSAQGTLSKLTIVNTSAAEFYQINDSNAVVRKLNGVDSGILNWGAGGGH